jgi:hypothetical protein
MNVLKLQRYAGTFDRGPFVENTGFSTGFPMANCGRSPLLIVSQEVSSIPAERALLPSGRFP